MQQWANFTLKGDMTFNFNVQWAATYIMHYKTYVSYAPLNQYDYQLL